MKAHTTHRGTLLTTLLAGILLAGCGGEEATTTLATAEGQQIWESNCRVCHLNGIAGAPRLGNKQDWADRIEQGIAVLASHAINGFQRPGSEMAMPPKGGNTHLSDDEITAAVTYMVSQSR